MEVGFSALHRHARAARCESCKAGKEPDLTQPLGVATEINLHAPALLPEDYCSDVHERLVLYKRLANCDDRGRARTQHAGGAGRPLRRSCRSRRGRCSTRHRLRHPRRSRSASPRSTPGERQHPAAVRAATRRSTRRASSSSSRRTATSSWPAPTGCC
ncbi:MAG: hypothetical protein MZW92_50105 [Comamonadaceae bacterium]|nr:hypothetical protein [Comamonadaceae bacterium]